VSDLAQSEESGDRGALDGVRVLDPVTIPAYPVKMSRSPVRVAPPPQPGQHTAEVLRDWLGPDAAATESGAGR
jgi:crotonobetainyl-CoA:carnitine CoA-transferase CaiB-like acyl-CoA transferase